MSKTTIEIEHLQGGQRRAYADSCYEAIITMKSNSLIDKAIFYYTLDMEKVKEITQLFVHPFVEKPTSWADPILKRCEAIGPTEEMVKESHPKWIPKKESRWHVMVVQPYTDYEK